MRIARHSIPIKGAGHCIKISALGDWHVGAAACDRDYIRRTVGRIAKEPNHYVLLMGDMADMIKLGDKRYNPEIVDRAVPMCEDLVQWQIDAVEEHLAPLRGRILAGLVGNHCATINKSYGVRPMDILANRLQFPCLGYSGFVVLTFPYGKSNVSTAQATVIYMHHGHGGGRRRGGKVNKIEDFATCYEADVYLMGHVHTVCSFSAARLGVTHSSKPSLVSRDQHFAITGTALKTLQWEPDREEAAITYSEQFGFAPAAIGHTEITIWPSKGKLHRPKIEIKDVLG